MKKYYLLIFCSLILGFFYLNHSKTKNSPIAKSSKVDFIQNANQTNVTRSISSISNNNQNNQKAYSQIIIDDQSNTEKLQIKTFIPKGKHLFDAEKIKEISKDADVEILSRDE
jgi:5,10-methylenetetrahydrofolate reductase